MKYKGVMPVDQTMASEMERICREPDASRGKDGVEFDQEYRFANGIRTVSYTHLTLPTKRIV